MVRGLPPHHSSLMRISQNCRIYTPAQPANESTAAVAERCGYENAEHFYRQFKAVTGKTPRAFREGGAPAK